MPSMDAIYFIQPSKEKYTILFSFFFNHICFCICFQESAYHGHSLTYTIMNFFSLFFLHFVFSLSISWMLCFLLPLSFVYMTASILWIHFNPVFLLACSVIMFLSDMSGREPLYKKYVKNSNFLQILVFISFQNCSQHYSDYCLLFGFQGICIFQFTNPKGICKSHQEWYKCITPHMCIERGQDLHFVFL